MCMGGIGKTLLSPISTSTGRAALTGGALGAAAAIANGKGKKRAAVMPAPVLEPRRDLRNSSIFNNSY